MHLKHGHSPRAQVAFLKFPKQQRRTMPDMSQQTIQGRFHFPHPLLPWVITRTTSEHLYRTTTFMHFLPEL
jgi:hypothetical protein